MSGQVDPNDENWFTTSLSPYINHIGGLWMNNSNDENTYKVQVKPNHLNTVKFTHGGFLLAFIDTSMGDAASRACDMQYCVTMSLTTNFIGTSNSGDTIISKPIVNKRTAQFCYVTTTITDEKDKIIATASGVWKPLKKELAKRLANR